MYVFPRGAKAALLAIAARFTAVWDAYILIAIASTRHTRRTYVYAWGIGDGEPWWWLVNSRWRV